MHIGAGVNCKYFKSTLRLSVFVFVKAFRAHFLPLNLLFLDATQDLTDPTKV